MQMPPQACRAKLEVLVSEQKWGAQCWGLPPDATIQQAHPLRSCLVLEEAISISFWPAVDAGLPDWPTQSKHTIILFTLGAPLSLKLNNALKDLRSLLLGSVISGL